MPLPVHIFVRNNDDGEVTAATAASVTLLERASLGSSLWPHDDFLPTHEHVSEGRFEHVGGPESEPKAGEFLLVVKAGTERSPVVQRVTFFVEGELVRAKAGWKGLGAGEQAATVSLTNFGQIKSDADTPKNSVIAVSLFPTQHFIGLASHNHHQEVEGTQFINFARGRRNVLGRRGTLNLGAIAHILHVDKKVEEISVRAVANTEDQWTVVATRPRLGPPAPEPAEGETIDPEAIGILDFYALIRDVASNFPGTLVEAAQFGHAWHQGPLVRGTFDTSPSFLERDPRDADGRPKDFHEQSRVTSAASPKLDDAFAEDGRLVIYGCAHMSHVFREASQALLRIKDNIPRDQFFTVDVGSFKLRTTLDFSKRSIAQYIVSTVLGRYLEQGEAAGYATYNGLMARALKTRVFAAAPGAESNFGHPLGKQDLLMFVQPPKDTPLEESLRRMFEPDVGENHGIHAYFLTEFKDNYERDELGYTDYQKLLDVSLPDPGFRTERHSIYIEDGTARATLRLPSGFRVQITKARGGRVSSFRAPFVHSEGGVDGHAYAVPRCTVLGMERRDHTTLGEMRVLALAPGGNVDIVLWVTRDGRTLLRQRDTGSTTLREPASPVEISTMKLLHDPYWTFDKDVPAGTTEGALLEQVAPKCFW